MVIRLPVGFSPVNVAGGRENSTVEPRHWVSEPLNSAHTELCGPVARKKTPGLVIISP